MLISAVIQFCHVRFLNATLSYHYVTGEEAPSTAISRISNHEILAWHCSPLALLRFFLYSNAEPGSTFEQSDLAGTLSDNHDTYLLEGRQAYPLKWKILACIGAANSAASARETLIQHYELRNFWPKA